MRQRCIAISWRVKKMSMYVPTNEEITKITVQYFKDQGFDVKDL